MKCVCGADLGDVTVKTVGLCAECDRSKWIQAAYAQEPNSQAIVETLNEKQSVGCACSHRKTVCYSVCGVERDGAGIWRTIEKDRRASWFRSMLRLEAQP